jgi:hypothetical protein
MYRYMASNAISHQYLRVVVHFVFQQGERDAVIIIMEAHVCTSQGFSGRDVSGLFWMCPHTTHPTSAGLHRVTAALRPRR